MDEVLDNSHLDKVLCTAANGMEVWVPIEKLEDWKKAQADQSPEAKARIAARARKAVELLHRMARDADESSDLPVSLPTVSMSQPNSELFAKPSQILPDQFRTRYLEILRTYPFSEDMIGLENPYTGHKIHGIADYRLMLREKVYDEYCHQMSAVIAQVNTENLALQTRVGDLQNQVEKKTADAAALNMRLAEASARVGEAEEREKEAKKHEHDALSRESDAKRSLRDAQEQRTTTCKRFLALIAALIIAAVFFGVRSSNNAYESGAADREEALTESIAVLESEAYEEGRQSGYSSGKDDGYVDGKNEGYQAGYAEGKGDGYNEGRDDGYQSAIEQVERSGRTTSTSDFDQYWNERHGSNSSAGSSAPSGGGLPSYNSDPIAITYIGNKSSHKFHRPTCSSLPAQKNQVTFNSRDEAIAAGYTPCQRCNP